LDSSGEPITDPQDVEPVMAQVTAHPTDELVTDPMESLPVMEPMDKQFVNPVNKPDKTRWETPTLCSTCVQAK